MMNYFLPALSSDFFSNRDVRLNVLRDLIITVEMICAIEHAENGFISDTQHNMGRESVTENLHTSIDDLLEAYEEFQHSLRTEYDEYIPDFDEIHDSTSNSELQQQIDDCEIPF